VRERRRRTEFLNVSPFELVRTNQLIALRDDLADVRNDEIVEIMVGV
jgi:hypothetical protein